MKATDSGNTIRFVLALILPITCSVLIGALFPTPLLAEPDNAADPWKRVAALRAKAEELLDSVESDQDYGSELRQKARESLLQASPLLVEEYQRSQKELAKYHELSPEWDRIRSKQVRAEYALCEITQKIAETYEKGSEEHKKQLELAAEKYEQFYDNHDTLLIGLQAIHYAGICYRDMENEEFALSCFESLLGDEELRKVEALRPLLHKTVLAAFPIWNDQIKKAKTHNEAVSAFSLAFGQSDLPIDDPEKVAPEQLEIEFRRARLAAYLAARMKSSKNAKVRKQYEELMTEATTLAKFVAEREGKHQEAAAKLLEWLDEQ